MAAFRDHREFVAAVARMTPYGEHGPSEGGDDAMATLNRLIEEARDLIGPEPVTVDEKWIRHATDHGAEFHSPGRRGKFWTAYDSNEETWRVGVDDQCTTQADAARAYCESEGCYEPDGVDPNDIDTRAE